MLTKICAQCKVEYPMEAFRVVSKLKDGSPRRGPLCRECYNHKTRLATRRQRPRQLAYEQRHRSKVRTWYIEYLKTCKCADCGIADSRVLEFDHNDPKEKKYAVGVAVSHGLPALKAEIAKCTVRCANCHRIKTATEQSWYYE